MSSFLLKLVSPVFPAVLTLAAVFCIDRVCRKLRHITSARDGIFKISLAWSLAFLLSITALKAQVHYSGAATYGLRKLVPSYTGKAIQVRRICDNATKDIGFGSGGDLDTVALKAFVVAANPLTAISTSATAAFSLRRLRCAYSGSAIRVQSDASGTPTLDIGFTAAGDLDTAALKTFVGSHNGYVIIWYDQSGNSHNASNTSTLQPRIVTAGKVERQNAMPAICWLGQNCSLATAPFTGYATAACFNGVAKVRSDLTYNAIVNKTTSNIPAPLDFYNAQGVFGNGTAYVFATCTQSFDATKPLGIWTVQYAASTFSYNFFHNGSAAGNGTGSVYSDNGNQLTLGGRVDNTTGLDGWISEVITFASIPTTTERQFVEWSQSQYYEISGPALSTLPGAPSSGYVSVWYDQSGNGRHATQSTVANQPKLVNSGSIYKNGSNPAISFEGSPENLVAPLCSSVYPISIALQANTSGASTSGAFVKHGSGTDGIAIGVGNGIMDNSGTFVTGLKENVAWCPSNPNNSYPSGSFVSTTIQKASGELTTFLNGTNIPLSNSSTAVGASMSGSLFVGGYVNAASRFAVAKQSEVSVFASALSVTRRTLIETNQAAYNSITISNSKYTPPSAGSYNRYVNGIGKESTDSIAGTPSTTGMGFNGATGFLQDPGDYITIGMNSPITGSTSASNLPFGYVTRWADDWYLVKTDATTHTGGTLTVFFDFQDYGATAAPTNTANYDLLSRTSPTANFTVVTSLSKQIVGDRVMFNLNATSLTTNRYYTIGSKSTSSPLPIELLSFNAVCINNTIELNWSTATQQNNDYFTVERTVDGVHFDVIGTVRGAGNNSSLLKYKLTDEQPVAGTSYYRLKQTDFNGKSETFQLVTVSCVASGTDIKIYPNPANGNFVVEGAAANSNIAVLNSLGEIMAQQTAVSLKQSIDISALPAGIYVVKIGSDNPLTKKLVLQR